MRIKIYRRDLANKLTISTGKYALVRIRGLGVYQGRIGKIFVKQVGGTGVAFKVDLLDRPIFAVSETTDVFESDIATDPLPVDIDINRVLPQLSGLSAASAEEYVPKTGGDGYLFENAESNDPSPRRWIYLLIQPTGAVGPTDWVYSLGATSEIG